jgi:bacteriocin-like protein
MKTPKKLTQKELKEINGGNSTSANQSGLIGDLGIGNLASFSSSSQNGDQSSSSSFSAGNDIDTSLGGILNNGSSKL